MSVTGALTDVEADAMRAAASLPDGELAERLGELADAVAHDVDDDLGPGELRELAAVAFIAARRLETSA